MFLSHSALTTIRESRLVFVHNGGLKRCWGLLVEAGVVPALVDLFRDGDEQGKLLAGNALGIIAAQTEYIRPVNEAGSIPLYVELLSGGHPMGKDIAEDVFCILAVAEGNAVLIAEQLVRILREGDNEAKFVASDVLWDLAGYRHSVCY
ncbi:hypothetical protein Bca52824_049086 [Brassica carinata]|uniref:Uncharacterized protein n=1 Tax=Brassica carinata TaxID=52824 RepID=A0A8X7RK92_BRACI|nr:hypothetical protein Bca52824_049086 [Brassica carinata]